MNPSKSILLSLLQSDAVSAFEMSILTYFQEVAVENVPPSEVSSSFLKSKGFRLVITDQVKFVETNLLSDDPFFKKVAWMVLGNPPVKSEFPWYEYMTGGKVQFIESFADESRYNVMIKKWVDSNETISVSSLPARKLAAGSLVFKKGDDSKDVYLLKVGKLRAQLDQGGRAPVIFGEIGPGEFFGEMAHFTGEKRTADVIALVDSEVITMKGREFDLALLDRPDWCKKLIESLSRRLKDAIEQKY